MNAIEQALRAKAPEVFTAADTAAPVAPVNIAPDTAMARARAYLATIEPAIEGQAGDAATFRAACVLVRDFNLSEPDAVDLLTEWNIRCVPPWTLEELQTKVRNASRYGVHPHGAKLEIVGRFREHPEPPPHIAEAPDPEPDAVPAGLDATHLADAVDIIREGQQIALEGVRYTVEAIIPNYGMLGMLVAFAKVGKTTLGQALGADVAMDRPFLDHATTRCRVLDIAAEDPPEYTAYLARTLKVERGWMTFYRAPIRLDTAGLDAIRTTVTEGRYGLVLISSWQSVVRGLIQDENDNAGAVCVVEHVKAAARLSGVPWLIDAHSGKGEDQSDDADPTKALRGASAAAGAADYTLSLRYGNGAFGTQRRLSGKGRFVSFSPLVMDFDPMTSTYTAVGSANAVTRETTWRLICETGALSDEPQSTTDIARRIGMVRDGDRLSGGQRQQIRDALRDRADVAIVQGIVRGQKTTRYTRLVGLS